MSRKKQQEKREARDAYRQRLKEERLERAEEQVVREKKCEEALARKSEINIPHSLNPELGQALKVKAPKLLVTEYVPALIRLGGTQWIRPIEDWKPKGKGYDTLFQSLCEHLLAKYPVPKFLWTAFFDADDGFGYADPDLEYLPPHKIAAHIAGAAVCMP